jgi:hypothetical protein
MRRGPLHAGLALDPTFTIARFHGAPSDNPTYRATWRSIRDGLHKEGRTLSAHGRSIEIRPQTSAALAARAAYETGLNIGHAHADTI